MKSESYLVPEWPAPAHVKAFNTTRLAGISKGPFASFNLGDHVQDIPETVAHNRQQLKQDLQLNSTIQFLKQVHGTCAINLAHEYDISADAAYTQQATQVCAVLTADCLPLLVTDRAGNAVAAIHAGWRGLLAGVIDETIKLFQAPRAELLVWLGPAIGPCHFEINETIRDDFLKVNPLSQTAFKAQEQKLYGDLYQLARNNLQALGIEQIYGGKHCTYCENELFYSHRRDQGYTGRQASLIWVESTRH